MNSMEDIPMMKRIVAVLLAGLMLGALASCAKNDGGITDDTVINIGTQEMTYQDTNGDTFTYEYLTSTTVRITGFSGNYEPHEVVIPAKIENRDVTEIGAEAFTSSSCIKSLKIDAALVCIGNYAFSNCQSLESISFPSSLEEIGRCAFYGCSSLVELNVPASLKSIDGGAFKDCAAIADVTFPSALLEIGEVAFSGCHALTEITLAEGITTVGAQAFYNCDAVTSMTLPASLTEIGDWAFATQIKILTDDQIHVVEGSVADQLIASQR